ncbi:MAG: energy transducer TonB [Tsuneonella sp.]
MYKSLQWFLFAGLAFSPVQVRAEPLRLEPSSNWNVNYDEDSCRLARLFGSGDNEVLFYVDRYEPSDNLLLVVAGKPLTGGPQTRALLRFGPTGEQQRRPVQVGAVGKYSPAGVTPPIRLAGPVQEQGSGSASSPVRPKTRDQIAAEELAFAKGVTWLSVSEFSSRDLVLELGDMAAPIAALQTCTRELVTHWGIDAEGNGSLTRPAGPKGNPAEWFSSNDYPTEMLREGMEGLVQFRVMVDQNGKPTGCHIQKSTRPQGFDDAVCKALMEKGEFEPALDRAGQPVASYYHSAVRFDIPTATSSRSRVRH